MLQLASAARAAFHDKASSPLSPCGKAHHLVAKFGWILAWVICLACHKDTQLVVHSICMILMK